MPFVNITPAKTEIQHDHCGPFCRKMSEYNLPKGETLE